MHTHWTDRSRHRIAEGKQMPARAQPPDRQRGHTSDAEGKQKQARQQQSAACNEGPSEGQAVSVEDGKEAKVKGMR